MRWEDERYVRLYTRDTVDWLGLSFPAQGLFCLLLRKVDRAGILPLGKHGKRAVAVAVGHGHQWAMLEEPLEELLADGCIRIEGDRLLVPNFIEAQEAIQSDAARKRTQRERDRANVTKRDGGGTSGVASAANMSLGGTDRHETGTESHAVTDAVPSVTPDVTPNHAVPSMPSQASPPTRARATLVSPFPPGRDPAPNVTTVLAELHARGIVDAAPPSARSEATVEAVIASVGVDVAVQRLAAVLADPNAKRPLTYHVDAIRSQPKPKPSGDLGCDNDPWHWHLTPELERAYREKRHAVAPELDDAPIGIVGPERELAALNDEFKALVEAGS